MTFRRAVAYKLSGPVDQPTLDGLVARLQLERMGRLTDDWDQIFGERQFETPEGHMTVVLARDAVRPGWNLNLGVAGRPSAATMQAVEAEVLAAVAACGLTVQNVLRLPEPS